MFLNLISHKPIDVRIILSLTTRFYTSIDNESMYVVLHVEHMRMYSHRYMYRYMYMYVFMYI